MNKGLFLTNFSIRQPNEPVDRATQPGAAASGQSMVEFALIAPVVIILLLGVLDLGRAFLTTITIRNAAREGARYATLHVIATTEQRDNLYDQVTKEIQAGHVATASTTISYNCSAFNPGTLQCAPGSTISVDVQNQYKSLFSFIFPATILLKANANLLMP